MIEFLISLLPTSLFIYGLNIIFQDGHVFEKQGEWITDKLGDKWSKPVINCSICMSSVYGTLWFFIGLQLGFDVHMHIKLWIPYVFCLAGLNTIINKLTSKERVILDE